ncbi:MAG: hypothetical protein HS109_06445 [Burkholderiales bacterium]|nr:hypothetical protein [Burkholderiales bacterium]
MQESQGAAGAGYGAAGRALIAIARGFAVAGGFVFVALVAMEIVSIVGRKLFAWSVPGDVELLQMCAAFASAAFFAYCHLVGLTFRTSADAFLGNFPIARRSQ